MDHRSAEQNLEAVEHGNMPTANGVTTPFPTSPNHPTSPTGLLGLYRGKCYTSKLSDGGSSTPLPAEQAFQGSRTRFLGRRHLFDQLVFERDKSRNSACPRFLSKYGIGCIISFSFVCPGFFPHIKPHWVELQLLRSGNRVSDRNAQPCKSSFSRISLRRSIIGSIAQVPGRADARMHVLDR